MPRPKLGCGAKERRKNVCTSFKQSRNAHIIVVSEFYWVILKLILV
jgi:hypothetical protein